MPTQIKPDTRVAPHPRTSADKKAKPKEKPQPRVVFKDFASI